MCYNEEEILPYTLRHYVSFCDRVTLHDMGSRDKSLDIAAKFGIGTVHWDTKELVDETVNMKIRNESWLGTDADWVIVADADEFIYFPKGVKDTLESYEKQNIPVAKPHGWEMFSETMPVGDGQIYDEIKYGARDDRWYSKCVLFRPSLIKAIDFGPGAHHCDVWLHNGKHFIPDQKSEPPFYLLHYHQIGSVERLAAKYDDLIRRMSEGNKINKWGNFKPGAVHVQEKRTKIIPRLEKVV